MFLMFYNSLVFGKNVLFSVINISIISKIDFSFSVSTVFYQFYFYFFRRRGERRHYLGFCKNYLKVTDERGVNLNVFEFCICRDQLRLGFDHTLKRGRHDGNSLYARQRMSCVSVAQLFHFISIILMFIYVLIQNQVYRHFRYHKIKRPNKNARKFH